jgi:hypothetical protein
MSQFLWPARVGKFAVPAYFYCRKTRGPALILYDPGYPRFVSKAIATAKNKSLNEIGDFEDNLGKFFGPRILETPCTIRK